MGQSDNNLFSLELVVEKLYLPHTACRFPAVAFRLLDFPTIVIKHVEDDLGKAIRQKISFDPSYELPKQFIELKDKSGNFMIKKGKSCLFAMTPDVLKQHLINTPLYVMVIDLFPETPKLVGNSTVPLDSVMEKICVDIVKLGMTVPSVHGDKGLFKLYNLMGKEIGYFVLGFRLLSLGPGMISHLPDSMLLKRQSNRKQKQEESKVNAMLNRTDQQREEEEVHSEESMVELRNSACMTDPVRQDAFMQTIELEDKAVHVEFLNEKVGLVDNARPIANNLPSMAKFTQTDKKKRSKDVKNIQMKKWVEQDHLKVEDDGPIINNIVCPPPLFYNSEAGPPISIERDNAQDDDSWELSSVGDTSDIDSSNGQRLEVEEKTMEDFSFMKASVHIGQDKQFIQTSKPKHVTIPQARENEFIKGLNVAPQPNAIFPLLTALIQELSCIQNPELLLGVSQRIQAAEVKQQQRLESKSQKKENISPSAVSVVAAALASKSMASRIKNRETGIDNMKQEEPIKKDTANKVDVSKSRSFLQKENSAKIKGKKLVYGMTNTQRLRLQKSNPGWLKNVEREAAANSIKSSTKQNDERREMEELNTMTNFSDTLTEVRRLAEIEMNSTAGGDTIRQVVGEMDKTGENYKSTKDIKTKTFSTKQRKFPASTKFDTAPSPLCRVSKQSPPRASRHSPSSSLRKSSQLSKSRSHGSVQKSAGSKPRSRVRQRRVVQQKELGNSSDSDELLVRKKPVPMQRHISLNSQHDEQKHNDLEDGLSARSDIPSSRSRSIDVRLPSADIVADDNATISDDEYERERDMDDENDDEVDDDDDIPLPDESMSEKPKVQVLNFPRYVARGDVSLPGSIEGEPNGSLNGTGALDENSPMESTRHSKNMTEEQNDSNVLHSTEYSTRQFHSTEEPELQGLVSEEENPSDPVVSGRQSVASVRQSQKFPMINPQMSQNSPVPSVRRSTTKLDAGGNSYLPSMSASKGHVSPSSSRSSTPVRKSPSKTKKKTFEPLIPNREGKRVRGSITPRSTSSSPRRPTPRARRAPIDFKTSIHTDSLSSYMPSDPENVMVSLSSNSGNYSDDFMPLGSGESADVGSSVEQLPKLIPSAKLGYTIS